MVPKRDGEVAGIGQFLAYNTAPVSGTLWYRTKGPWLPWDDEEAVRTFFERARALAKHQGAHTVKIEPKVLERRKDVKALLGNIGFRNARYNLNDKTTLVVDLEPSEEELLARMKSKTRYNIRLAARKGVKVTQPDDFEEAWEALYSLSKTTAERNGFPIRRSREHLRDVAFKTPYGESTNSSRGSAARSRTSRLPRPARQTDARQTVGQSEARLLPPLSGGQAQHLLLDKLSRWPGSLFSGGVAHRVLLRRRSCYAGGTESGYRGAGRLSFGTIPRCGWGTERASTLR